MMAPLIPSSTKKHKKNDKVGPPLTKLSESRHTITHPQTRGPEALTKNVDYLKIVFSLTVPRRCIFC